MLIPAAGRIRQMEHKHWTAEELRLSTPYEDLEAWVNVLVAERLLGRSRYQGPPGLLAQVEALLSSTTAQEMTEMLLEDRIPIEKIKAGLAAASSSQAT